MRAGPKSSEKRETQDWPQEDGGRDQGCDPKPRHARDCQQSWERGLEEASPRALDGVQPPGLQNQERISVVLSPPVSGHCYCSSRTLTDSSPPWAGRGGRQRQLLTSDTPPGPDLAQLGPLLASWPCAECWVSLTPPFLAAFVSQPGWSRQCTRHRFLHYFGLFFFFL